MSEPPLKPHQIRGLEAIKEAIAQGRKRILVTSPTGGGKTRMIAELCKWAMAASLIVVVYTNRRLLISQTSEKFAEAEVDHGIMAAGYQPAFLRHVQIASIPTIESRVYQKKSWELPRANLVIVDEAHLQNGDVAKKILTDHVEAGAQAYIGFTATPVSLGDTYDHLIVAGTKAELRECGLLVPAITYAPDEPDLHRVKRNANGEYVIEDVVKRVMVTEEGGTAPRICGRIVEHCRKINPLGAPGLLFGPDVPSSRYLAQYLTKNDIPAAHIDAETPDDERQAILQGSQDGRIQVICNRFVMREGIDAPWIVHGIFATAFGCLSSWLQSGGRLLRAYEGIKKHALIQDHGGNFYRHGSLNDDFPWSLDATDRKIASDRIKKLRQADPNTHEGIVCPECSFVRRTGRKCPACGHEHARSVRMVIQTDGTLKRQQGNAVKHKQIVSPDQKAWDRCFFACLNSRKDPTLRQAGLWFQQITGHWPPIHLRRRPPDNSPDWGRRVRDFYRPKHRSP